MGGSRVPVLVVIGIGLALGVGAIFLPKAAPGPELVLTQEAKDYLDHLALSEVTMQAADTYTKASLVSITGKIANKGARKLRSIHVNCVFRDVNRQVIKREQKTLLWYKSNGIEPGETRGFKWHFDDIPEGWNQTMPDLVIGEISFRE